MQFYLNYFIPSLNKNLNLRELSFKQFFTLNKFVTNNNNQHISDCFDSILRENLVETEFFPYLNNFDKFIGLYLLRSSCVSPEVELKKDKSIVKIALHTFLSKCVDKKPETIKNFAFNNLKIDLNLPKTLYSPNTLDILYETVSSIYIDDKKIDLMTLSSHERTKIVEQLPAQLFETIKNYCNSMEELFSDLYLEFKLVSENKIIINPFNNSMYEILKAFYQTDLISLYELQYILVNKLFYTPEYVDNNTLVENILLTNFYRSEVEKINAEQSKNMDKSIPLGK